MLSVLLSFVLLGACAEPEAEPEGCALSESPEVLVVRALHIVIADELGVSEGFDQDGTTSTEDGVSGCGIADYVSPDGVSGIDNAFSRIVPTLNATEARISTIEGLVQDSINSGELLIAIEIGGIQDWESDECVAVQVGQAEGDAMLGTDGLLLDGQTFDRELDSPTAQAESGKVVDGALFASSLSLDLPVQILDVALSLPIRDGFLSISPSSDNAFSGVLGGAIPVAFVSEVGNGDGVNDAVGQLLDAVLSVNADLPDETGADCAAMSMTLGFEAVGAYYYE